MKYEKMGKIRMWNRNPIERLRSLWYYLNYTASSVADEK